MSLPAGTRLGPYEILAPIGAGGMDEVYRARDSRLNRIIALKVLLADTASDPAARGRFDREARAIAALNHPGICTLHDVGHDQGIDYLVMEFVDGQTLAERIARGSMPISQVRDAHIHDRFPNQSDPPLETEGRTLTDGVTPRPADR